MTDPENDAEPESLPFDVELERLPAWVHVASGLVVITGALVSVHVIPMLALLPLLIASSIGRRFLHVAMHVEVVEGGIELPSRTIGASEIRDVWLDSDAAEPRVTVHYGAEGQRLDLLILYFVNRDQAIRFADALADPSRTTIVAGYAPRAVDVLSSLRFVAVGASFVEAGGWLSLPVFEVAALGGFAFFSAKQVIVKSDGFTVRTAFGETRHAYADVRSVVVDTGTIAIADGRDVTIGRAAIRDAMLAAPAWLERTRRRVLKQIRSSEHET